MKSLCHINSVHIRCDLELGEINNELVSVFTCNAVDIVAQTCDKSLGEKINRWMSRSGQTYHHRMKLTIVVSKQDFVVGPETFRHVVGVQYGYLTTESQALAHHLDVSVGYWQDAAGAIGGSTDRTKTLISSRYGDHRVVR